MKLRSFTIIAVFFAVMLVVVVIRSLLHPVQSVTLFIEHKDDAAWSPALSNTLFQGASIDFAGYQPIQLAGDDLGAWDEVAVMSSDSKESYRSFVGGLATDKTVRRYHLLEVLPQAPELLAFLNWRLAPIVMIKPSILEKACLLQTSYQTRFIWTDGWTCSVAIIAIVSLCSTFLPMRKIRR